MAYLLYAAMHAFDHTFQDGHRLPDAQLRVAQQLFRRAAGIADPSRSWKPTCSSQRLSTLPWTMCAGHCCCPHPARTWCRRKTGFIDAAKNSGVEHIVKFSGMNAADVGTFIFGTMHAEVETYLQRSGVSWTLFRPSQFMTEYLREVPTILSQNALFLPFKDIRLNPRAAFLLLTTSGHEGETYAFSGPEALTMDEIAQKISDATGHTVRYVDIPREDRNTALRAVGVPEFVVEALDAQTGQRLLGLESVVHLETHQALGLEPTTFSEFAARNAGAFLGETTYVGLR